jgi:hypothetical protein
MEEFSLSTAKFEMSMWVFNSKMINDWELEEWIKIDITNNIDY